MFNVHAQFRGEDGTHVVNNEPLPNYDAAQRYAHRTAYTIACIEGGNYESLPGKAHHIDKIGQIDITYTVVKA